jgi:hypothetical protein
MSFFDVGSAPVFSTGAGIATNPSTTTLCAEIDSTQLGALTGGSVLGFKGGRTVPCQVTWIVACSTVALLTLEQVVSTGLGDTAIVCETPLMVTVNQSGQYMTKHFINPGDRFRVRVEGSTFQATVAAKIFAEALA